MQLPLFNHLWFLWFLWWLVLGLAAISALGARLPSIRLPSWLVLSPARYLWLVPLTMIPQWFMGAGGDSALRAGCLLRPAADPARPGVLRNLLRLRGALFWVRRPVRSRRRALVAAAFDRPPRCLPAGDGPHARVARTSGRQARPAAAPGPFRFLAGGLPLAHDVRPHGVVSAVLPGREPDDAIPVGLGLLALPCTSAGDHRGPVRGAGLAVAALAKFLLIVTVVTSFLLWTYQNVVRYTWLGRFLNGPARSAREIRCQFIILARKDEPTPRG